MRGRIRSWLFSLPFSSVSPRLQYSVGNNVKLPSIHARSFASSQSSVLKSPEPGASFYLLSCNRRTVSVIQGLNCLGLPSLLHPLVQWHKASFLTQGNSFSASGRTEKLNSTCWACKQHEISGADRMLCPSCGAIQPLDLSVDHFSIFGIPRSFQVDSKLLEQKYKNLQKKLHPDLMSSKSEKEQQFSADQSAHVIRAYYTLLKPLSRARYLLKLEGIIVDKEETVDDPALLMEVMEIRESLESVSDTGELSKLRAENRVRIEDTEKAIEAAFLGGDLSKAVSLVQRLAYYNKVDEEIVRKL